jgi:hypothetical protein
MLWQSPDGHGGRTGKCQHGVMLFTKDAVPGLADGSITVTFRRWTRPQAKAGGRYRTWGMLLEVVDLRLVEAATITDAEAMLAGEPSAAALLRRLGEDSHRPIWRVQFRCVGADDRIERRNDIELDPGRRAELQSRLDRFDRASPTGPWTTRTLRLIAAYPGVVSTALARQLNVERQPFKINVRKLKELGLTESLEVGYRLSPLGRAFTGGADAAAARLPPSVTQQIDDGGAPES